MPSAIRPLILILLTALLAGCGSPGATSYYRDEQIMNQERSLNYQLSYNQNQNYFFFDETFFDLRFTIYADAYYSFNVTVTNQSDQPITIDWNRLEYVAVGGGAHSVIHQGVNYGDPVTQQRPTVIQPGMEYQDLIRPATRKMIDGAMRLMRPVRTPAAMNWSDSVVLMMPVKAEGIWRNYRLSLSVGEVGYNNDPFDPYW